MRLQRLQVHFDEYIVGYHEYKSFLPLSIGQESAQECTGNLLLQEFNHDDTVSHAITGLLAILGILVRVPTHTRPIISADAVTRENARKALIALSADKLFTAAGSVGECVKADLDADPDRETDFLICVKHRIANAQKQMRVYSRKPWRRTKYSVDSKLYSTKVTDAFFELVRDILKVVTTKNKKLKKNHLANLLVYFVALASSPAIPPHSSTFELYGEAASVKAFFEIDNLDLEISNKYN